MGVGCRGKITQGCDQNTRQKASVTNQQGKINNISSDGSVWEDRQEQTDRELANTTVMLAGVKRKASNRYNQSCAHKNKD